MKNGLVAALLGAISVAACSSGVLDLLPAGSGGSGGGAATTGAHGGETSSSRGGSPATTSDGGGGGGSASSTGGGGTGGACPDPNCPCGLSTCLGACVDTHNDPSFCGGCDNPCKHNQSCQNGQCECLPGFAMCSDGSCHQLASDPDHCGTCTKVCDEGQACDVGTCKAACDGGRHACPSSNSRLSCVELDSGEPFCGSCGTICGPTQVCSGQHCVDFKPATPCDTCPCATECTALFQSLSTCCAGIAGALQPICVHGADCPP